MTRKGSLELVCGSMFSGKSEELLRRLKRAEYARQNVLTIKPEIDTRRSAACVTTHSGMERKAFSFEGSGACWDQLMRMVKDDQIDVVGVDEVQFFPDTIIEVIKELVQLGKRVVVSGLDLDFRGEPFSFVPQLMAHADCVTKLRAICMVCGHDANFTQRLIDGRPAKYDDPIILVGAEECYEARCRSCFLAPQREQAALAASV